MNKSVFYNYPLVSLGSPYGIGYEVFLLSLKKNILKKYYPIVCIGSEKILKLFFKLLQIKIKYQSVNILNNDFTNLIYEKKNKFILINIDNKIGIQKNNIYSINSIEKDLDGLIAYNTIRYGADLVYKHFFKSIVTLPVNKENINKIDSSFKGHTEFFQKIWKEKKVYMTFISDKINIFLLTTHIPLNQVSITITKNVIKDGIEYSLKLKDKLKIKKKICFLGLNPHAGENGLIGKKDLLIKEVIKKYGMNQIIGPLPSDTVFTENNLKKYGFFISCYHDQGLIPFKMLSFDNGVNLSFGMKFIRTSVDHGTAYDLIGKKKANINSFINAYRLAIKLSK
jgi:4-hydroxythreonine-4-phosphate dehydrogenase